MSETPLFQVPDELAFLEAFEVEPSEALPKDGYWCYELVDQQGTTLRLSFNVFERWIQTELLVGGHKISRVAQEGAIRLSFTRNAEGPALEGKCQYRNAFSTLTVQVKPRILAEWVTLLTSD